MKYNHDHRSRLWAMTAMIAICGCGESPVVQVGSTTQPVAVVESGAVQADVAAAVVSTPTSQQSQAGDQVVHGDRNTTVGGGNSIRLDGGTVVAIVAIAVPVVMLGYLLSKGLIVVSAGVARRLCRPTRRG